MQEYDRLKTILSDREDEYMKAVHAYARAVRDYSDAKGNALIKHSGAKSAAAVDQAVDTDTRKLKGETEACEAEMRGRENRMWNVRKQMDTLGGVVSVVNNELRLAV